MSRQYLNELKDGVSVDEVYLVAEKQIRANRQANLYLSLDLRDKSGLINARLWNVTEDSVGTIDIGRFVRIKGKVHRFQGNLQIIATHVDPVPPDGLASEDFIPQSDQNAEELLDRLQKLLEPIDDPNLRALCDQILADDKLMAAFARVPAGVKAHHPYHGGLLEHVVTIMDVASRIGDLYPKLDTNLLLTGILLHDLGKVREISFDNTFLYTDEGQLVGHLIIGVEILDDQIRKLEQSRGHAFPTEMALRLKHMILSHHGQYEFGSPKLPMTPEAIALHYLDNLDAKLDEFTRVLEGDAASQSRWTAYHNRLQRKLFRGGDEDWTVSNGSER